MTDTNKLTSGTIFGGTYKIIDFIGEGGMGLVYEVEQVFMAKRMALKILKSEYLTEAVWKRFQAEGKAIARLDHNNIVRIYDMSQSEEGVPFYTMDLIVGMSLADYLQDYGRLTQAEALPIFRQVCAGLAYAHEHGIIHRDIKPGNIMLLGLNEEDNNIANKQVKIVDFGIAKLTDETGNTIQGLTKPGEVFGSPLYMSPEQCSGQKVDQRSDLYSVAVTLFQALTGKPPLLGKTAIETTIMHQMTVPRKMSEVLNDSGDSNKFEISPWLEEVVATMLEKIPDDRYSSLSEVADILLQIESGHSESPIATSRQSNKNNNEIEQEWQENTAQNKFSSPTNLVAIAAVVTMFCAVVIAAVMIHNQTTAAAKTQTTSTATEPEARKKTADAEENSSLNHANQAEIQADPKADKKELVNKENRERENPEASLDSTTITAVKKYLERPQSKYSEHKGRINKQYIVFSFPKEFSLGTMEIQIQNVRTDWPEAQGTVTCPERTLRKFTANATLRTFPQLLQGFRPTDLVELTIDGKAKSPETLIAEISELTNLAELNLNNSILPAEQTAKLNKLTNLIFLRLSNTKFEASNLADCTFLNKLVMLDLEKCENLLPILEKLKHSKALLKLNLNHTKLNQMELRALSEISSVTELSLNKSEVTNSDLNKLLSMSQLEILYIEKCKNLDPSCLETLKKFPALKKIKISQKLLNPDQRKILKSLQRKRNIELAIVDR